MKIIRNKEYYDQFYSILKEEKDRVRYHLDQANNYIQLYNATKGRKGVYRLLNKIAVKMNKWHVEKGTKIAKEQIVILINEMIELDKLVKEGEKP